jgi:hypothetical protein
VHSTPASSGRPDDTARSAQRRTEPKAPIRHGLAKDDGTSTDDQRALRDWAWATGRTDIINDLDLRDVARRAVELPTWTNVAQLAAILPSTLVPLGCEEKMRRLACGSERPEGGPDTPDLAELLAAAEQRVTAHIDRFTRGAQAD